MNSPRRRDEVRRLLEYFRPHRGRLALALVLIALHSAVPGALVLLVETVLDDVLIEKDAAGLARLPVAVVGLYALNGALGFGRGMLTRSVAWAVVTQLRSELFSALLRQDAGWHQRQGTGALVARLTHDVNNIQYGVSGIVTAVQKPLTLLVLLAAAARMSVELTLIAIVAVPVVVIPVRLLGRRLRQHTQAGLDNLADLSGSATESLSGIQTVKLFAGEGERIARFDQENQTQRRLQLQAFAARLLPSPIVEFVAALGVGAVIAWGGRTVFAGEMAPGELLAFLVAVGLLNDPLKGLAEVHTLTQRALAGASAVFAVLDREPALADAGTHVLSAADVSVRLDGVSFDYGGGPVLHEITLDVPMGSTLALVGPSGSGKTTIARLVGRLYDPTEGRVQIGGRDVREWTLASLRRQVAVVSQESFLFDDTVAANIRFGTPGAPLEAVEAAARAANAHDFIMGLEAGYQTRLEERGMRLSGGQRQRICIARALLKDAPLLVLDEATSALDRQSEALVQGALDKLMTGRTTLVIAHRLATIQGADEIVVLDHGRVVERGTWAELTAADGPFAAMWRGRGPASHQG